jgi:hypothetical protein
MPHHALRSFGCWVDARFNPHSHTIHFLVALFALAVVLPHVPAKAVEVKLKKAREDFLKRDKKNSGYTPTTIQIGEDERRIAFVYVVMRQLVVVVFWCGLMWSWFLIFLICRIG